MTITLAVVLIFGMLFLVISTGIWSHEKLELKRLNSGYHEDAPETQTKSIDGNEIIHPADLYAIGGEFTITSGIDQHVCKKAMVLGKPTRDTLEVKWIIKE